ncbi:iron-sulfur cluster assembly scaffold protein [Actibacterium sp. XHP0104]|uniref:iron-sulfur cluster assembly scaffold protein n=1 Tax=Actibacterium sp. XHP0104 TaxID=2984335 RepID=UPI0021E9806D|nr:iron-sulfur cluster assembly scaffold protein [Actibacterium sp. XHP0104]MCV2882997.1 iron-sulfur cluster assembly scaffold protein [Actibacterium sp. XHP0104]
MAQADAALAALYQPRIRELAARVRNDRRLGAPDVTVTCRSPVCGSMLTLDMTLRDGTVTELGWKARACTLGMASMGIVSRAAPGLTAPQIAQTGEAVARLLKGADDITFAEPWHDYAVFVAARDFPTRHGSILLPFTALAQGFAERAPA